MEKLQKLTLEFELFVYKTIHESSFDVNQEKYLKHLSNFFDLDGSEILSTKSDFSYLELISIYDLVEKYEETCFYKISNLQTVQNLKKGAIKINCLKDYEKFVNDAISNNSFDLEKNVEYLNELFRAVKILNSQDIEKTIELIQLFYASGRKVRQ